VAYGKSELRVHAKLFAVMHSYTRYVSDPRIAIEETWRRVKILRFADAVCCEETELGSTQLAVFPELRERPTGSNNVAAQGS
jgi:hypothetical protein